MIIRVSDLEATAAPDREQAELKRQTMAVLAGSV